MTAHPETVRVLVVDDEQNIADSLVLILQAKGYDARVAYSAEEAVIVAEQFRPHGIISDVILRRMTGLELALYMGEQQPDCKVLLMSGYSSGLDMIDDSIRLGDFHTVLMKPVHPERLLVFVGSCAPDPSEP